MSKFYGGWPPPELEKPGLLPPRLEHGGASEDGVRQGPGRRPADVYVPHWGLHGAAAFDLAVTSGLRVGAVAGSRAPLKGCSLSLLSLKHSLAVGHLQPLRLGNSSRSRRWSHW